MRSLLQALQEGRLVELPETDKDKSLQYLAHLIEAIPEVAAEPLKELRDHNVLLFDFVLKRSLVNNGAGFARPVFETRAYFEKAA